MRTISILLLALTITACGSFSQQRFDDLELIKGNTGHVVKRQQEAKLTAVEFRTALETIDKSLLAEEALKGGKAELEPLRLRLLADSDAATEALFNGDNGR